MELSELHRYWNYAHDSGAGSSVEWCREYITFVSNLVAREGVRSVVDLGCGDFVVGSAIDYGDARVTGVDGSAQHIARLTGEHPSMAFINADVETFDATGFDLAICKDVLQHWPTERIVSFLSRPMARLTLITNDVGGGTVNGDIPYIPMDGDRLQVAVRGLDLRAEPFNVVAEEVLTFSGKSCLLIRGGSAAGAQVT